MTNISKDFLYYFRNSFDQGYHLMETLRRMTIFVIGTLGVLNLVLIEYMHMHSTTMKKVI
ncbi:hypothetical protein FCG55_023715 [Escherichia coli]|nr:hypothetical protein FCG55_023715 [Escherichia coli]